MTMTPMMMPIYLSNSGGSGAGTLGDLLAAIGIFGLAFQYAAWGMFLYEDEFKTRKEAIFWLIPGWPIVAFVLTVVRKFREMK